MKTLLFCTTILLLSGCGMFSSAPVTKFMAEQEMAPVDYGSIAPLQEVEDRLTKAFNDQADWDEHDKDALIAALAAVKAEFAWLQYEAQTGGKLSYYDVVVANKKINHWWSIAERILDEISASGEIDSDTSLIYFYVRRDIRANLGKWNQTINAASEAINSKIRRYDIDQIKDAYAALKPFLATVL